MNDQINQSPTSQELQPKKNNNKTLLIVGIVVGMLLVMGIGYYLGTTGFFERNKIDHIENNDEIKVDDSKNDTDENQNNDEVKADNSKNITECGVSEKFIFDSIKALDSKIIVNKYFPDFFKPFDLNPEYSVFDSYLTDRVGKGCIISEKYIYLKDDNKVYFYSSFNQDIYKDTDGYNSLLLWLYSKDRILAEDIAKKYDNDCIYPTKYDSSDLYNVEIRECESSGELFFKPDYDYPGKLVARYTVDLNTKKYTVEDFR